MKTTTMRTMIAAAALVVAAGSASAQTYKADVPVAFQVGSKVMAAGSYSVRLIDNSVGKTVIVYNRATNTSAALVSSVKTDTPKSWLAAGNPVITFDCVDSVCRLGKLWTGSDSFAYRLSTPKAPNGDMVAHRTTIVTLSMINAH
jgi:hypothetical protein